jgi:hypothetical protein
MRGLTKFSLRTTKPVRNTLLDLFSGTPGYIPLPCNMLRHVDSLTGNLFIYLFLIYSISCFTSDGHGQYGENLVRHLLFSEIRR